MSVWCLEAYDTELRKVTHREYTRSKRRAQQWANVPRLQFSDSGHGVVFRSREHSGPREAALALDGRRAYAEDQMRRM